MVEKMHDARAARPQVLTMAAAASVPTSETARTQSAPAAADSSWALSQPSSPNTVLARGGPDGYACLRIPSIVANGSQLMVFAQARRGVDCAYSPSDVVSSRSSDGGVSWSPMRVTLHHNQFGDEGDGMWSPSPVFDRITGELLLVFNRMLAADKDGHEMETWLVRSRDFGISWSKPENMSYVHNESTWICWTTGPGAALQLSSGRLVVQGYHGTVAAGCGDPSALHGHVVLSDDHGERGHAVARTRVPWYTV